MSICRKDSFDLFCTTQKEVLALEKEISSTQISEKNYIQIHQAIATTQNMLHSCIGLICSSLQMEVFEALEKELISLYGKLENRFEEDRVLQLCQKTLQLKPLLLNNKPMHQAARAASFVQQSISQLLRKRAPSLKHRKILTSLSAMTALAKKIDDSYRELQLTASPLWIEWERLESQLTFLMQQDDSYFAEELFDLYHSKRSPRKSKTKKIVSLYSNETLKDDNRSFASAIR